LSDNRGKKRKLKPVTDAPSVATRLIIADPSEIGKLGAENFSQPPPVTPS
jgi:hypothetical protein